MAAVPAFNPMAGKVTRLSADIERIEANIAALRKEASDLEEERNTMVAVFQEQLEQNSKQIDEDVDQADAEKEVAEPGTELELSQLREELSRTRQACARRTAQRAREVATLRADVEKRELRVQRVSKASQAMSASADADAADLEDLQESSRQLTSEADELEAQALKMGCQVRAWGVRLEEARCRAAEADETWKRREETLVAELQAHQDSADKVRLQLAEANALCHRLKDEVAELDRVPEGSRRRACREWGAQTSYLSEESRLREQVEKLTAELEHASRRAGAGDVALPALQSLLSLCLRPDLEPGERSAAASRASAALSDSRHPVSGSRLPPLAI